MDKKLLLAYRIALAVAVLVVSFSWARAEGNLLGAVSKPSPGEPRTSVYAGIYVNQVHSLEIANNKFAVDFWIWFRWKERDFKPLETFELVNGSIQSKEHATEKMIQDWHYHYCRVCAVVNHHFDVSRFPLDNQVLPIAVEDGVNEDDKVAFIADTANCGIDPDVQLPAWNICSATPDAASHLYTSNYGDISLQTGSQSQYSRFTYAIRLCRSGSGLPQFFKVFWTVFLAAAVAIMAVLVNRETCFGLGVAALFAGVANAYVISSALPGSDQMTLADKLNAVSVGFIVLSLVVSTVSLRVAQAGHERRAKKVDFFSFVLLFVAYLAGNVFLVMTC